MNKSRIISITFLVLFHIMLVSAFVTHINDSSTYALFAIYLSISKESFAWTPVTDVLVLMTFDARSDILSLE